MKLSFEEFKEEAQRVAGYLKTRVSRVFNNEGNYVALIDECDAFDRTKLTGRVSSRKVTFRCGADHQWVYEVQ